MSSRGYDGVLPTFQKRWQAGEIGRVEEGEETDKQKAERWSRVDRDSSRHGRAALNELHMHNSAVAWFRCTRGTQKRFPAGVDRQAQSFVEILLDWPARVGPGGPAMDGLDGMCRFPAALHSCIRAPQRNLVGFQGSAAARLCPDVHGCAYDVCTGGGTEGSCGGLASLLSACTGELRLLGPSSSTRTSQQHRISATLLARRDASPN